MMKILSIALSLRSQWFCLCLALAFAGCSKGEEFDGATAPYGPKTPTTQVRSTLTLSPSSLAGSLSTDTNISQVTTVVGRQTVGGTSYDRLATTRADDSSKGGEYWIKENSDETIDFAGYRHTSLANGFLQPASMTFTTPIKVNLEPPLNKPQSVTTSGTLMQGDTHATSTANVTGQYTLEEKNATVQTGVGPLSGCNHYSGQASSDSVGIPAILRNQLISAELWYHPSFGVVAFNAPNLGIGTVMTDTSDCGSVDSSGYRTIRKVAVVDSSSSSFRLDTHDCDGNDAADANTHASMLLELRWVDETKAETDSKPMPTVDFGVASGNYFASTITESSSSIFHPEENGKGFKYWKSYVNQADKNEGIAATAYHIAVGAVASPLRVTARIHYKVLPSLVVATPDGGPAYGSRTDGGPPTGSRVDGGLADGSRADGGRDGGGTVPDMAGTTMEVGGTGNGQETILFKIESLADVSYNPPQITTFTLPTASYITRVWTYHYAATIGTKSPTVAFKDTTSGTIYGPWAQVGYSSYAGTLGATRSDPGNIPGPPDNYWMAYPGATVPAGTYQVIDSDPTTWAYTADLGNRGVTWVYGYSLSGGGQDGGIDLVQSDVGAKADAKDGSAADSPTVDGAAGLDSAAGTGSDAGVPPGCGGATPCPTVIHSTTSGGSWSDTSTWIENVVPKAANDVEINGPVVIAVETPCNSLTIKSGGSLQNVGRGDPYGQTPTTVNGNLTIEAGGTLTNEPGYRSRIVVMGNCTNSGTIKNSASGVLLEVKKGFTQNGTYEGPSIAFTGGTDQTIACGAGKKITGSITVSNTSQSIKATSDVYLENVTVAMSDTTISGTFDMNGFKLFVTGASSALVTDDLSNHVPRIKYTNIAGINCADGATIYESIFANSAAPITIDGVLTTVGRSAGGTQVTFEGDLTVNAGATMQNELDYHSGVVVTGSLVNNGSVNGRSGGYGFEVKKNLTQNNVYTATETTFSGAGVETISMGAGKKIAGTIFLANAKSGGTLKALSDLTVENITFTVGDATTTTAIDMSQNKLVLVGGYNAFVCDDTSNHVPRVTFTNVGGITGASPDTATDPMIWESSFANTSGAITLAGQFRTVGRSAGGIQIRFTGNVVLAAGAVWRNEAGYRSGITISGSFTKNGTAVSDGGSSLLVINDAAY